MKTGCVPWYTFYTTIRKKIPQKIDVNCRKCLVTLGARLCVTDWFDLKGNNHTTTWDCCRESVFLTPQTNRKEILISVCCFRFCKDAFERDYKATIGVDFEIERFEISGVSFSLQMWVVWFEINCLAHISAPRASYSCFLHMFALVYSWDTAGQEKFKCIASAYYRGAQGKTVFYQPTLKRCFRIWYVFSILMMLKPLVDLFQW